MITLMFNLGRPNTYLAPFDDEGGGGSGESEDTSDIDAADDTDDDEGDDDGSEEPEDTSDINADDDEDEEEDDDQEKAGKGAEKRIRKLVEEKNDLKQEVEKLKKLAGDDGKAILAAAEATGILPGLMTRDEAKAFQDMQDIPGIIERYEDWLDDHGPDDELEIGNTTLSYGDVKKRVRKLRTTLADLKDTYGDRRKELSGKVREIFETGLAALKAGWKPDGKKTDAKKTKKKQPKEEKPTGKNPRELPRRGREWEGEVEDEDDLENFIAAENRKNRRKG